MTGHEEARLALLLARMTPPRGSNSGHVVLNWPDDLLVKRLLARLTMRHPPLAWPEAWGLLVWNDGAGIVIHPGPPTLWDGGLPGRQGLELARLELARRTGRLELEKRGGTRAAGHCAHGWLFENTRGRQGRAGVGVWTPHLALWQSGQPCLELCSKVTRLARLASMARRVVEGRGGHIDPAAHTGSVAHGRQRIPCVQGQILCETGHTPGLA